MRNLPCGFAGCGDCMTRMWVQAGVNYGMCIPVPAVLAAISWQSLKLLVAGCQSTGPGVKQTVAV